jgi:hypothetical protein
VNSFPLYSRLFTYYKKLSYIIYRAIPLTLQKLPNFLIINKIKTKIDSHSPLQTKSLVIYIPIINKMFQLITLNVSRNYNLIYYLKNIISMPELNNF